MPKRKVRIILDANGWVSFAIMRFQNKIAAVITNAVFDFFSCGELELEIKKILNEERIQKYLDNRIKKEFWYYYFEAVEYIKIKSSVILSRDKKDNYLLALAKDAKADFLITADKDLLVLKQFENTLIMTLTEFLKYLNKK
jgi:uncharacterized protein